MTCSDPECKRNMEREIKGIKKTMFGEDGLGGVAGAQKDTVTKKMVWCVFVVLGIPLAISLLGLWVFYKSADLRFASVKEVNAQTVRISLQEERTRTVLGRIEELRADLEKAVTEIKKEIRNGRSYDAGRGDREAGRTR